MKTLLILGAGGYQVTAVEKARQLGYRTIVLSNVENDVAFALADEYVLCSTTQIAEVLKVANRFRVDGVFTIASEIASQTAAVVAAELGLKWQNSNAVIQISDKKLLNKLLNKKEVSIETIKYPVIIKPNLASGSLGLTKVNSEKELTAAIYKAKDKSVIKEGYVIEPFYEGKHCSAVVVVKKGTVDFVFTTLKIQDENFCTLAHLTSTFSEDIKSSLKELLNVLFAKLEVEAGFFDVDFIITINNEVVIIELGSRLGGNGLAELVEHSTGYDVISSALQFSMGEDIVIPEIKEIRSVASVVLKSDVDGFFEALNIEVLDLEHRLFVKKGDAVRTFESGRDQFGIAFIEASNAFELQMEVKRILSLQHHIL